MKVSVHVEVLGREFTLQVEEENAERSRTVAHQVDQRMKAFQRQHPGQAKLTTALVTALAIAEDLHDEQEARRRDAEAREGDLRALTNTLTGALGEAPSGEESTQENGTAPDDFT